MEVLYVHPDVHPATFDGARDHRTQLRDLRAKIQGDLRDLTRSCAGLWLHEYHVILYENCVYCVIVIVIECNYRRMSIPVTEESEIRARSPKIGPKCKQEKLELTNEVI